jgi:hypothetical protein
MVTTPTCLWTPGLVVSTYLLPDILALPGLVLWEAIQSEENVKRSTERQLVPAG